MCRGEYNTAASSALVQPSTLLCPHFPPILYSHPPPRSSVHCTCSPYCMVADAAAAITAVNAAIKTATSSGGDLSSAAASVPAAEQVQAEAMVVAGRSNEKCPS